MGVVTPDSAKPEQVADLSTGQQDPRAEPCGLFTPLEYTQRAGSWRPQADANLDAHSDRDAPVPTVWAYRLWR